MSTPDIDRLMELAYAAARERPAFWWKNEPRIETWAESDGYKTLRTALQAALEARSGSAAEPVRPDTRTRAADMLVAYAELVKATGKYAEMHYIPEVEYVIAELRGEGEIIIPAWLRPGYAAPPAPEEVRQGMTWTRSSVQMPTPGSLIVKRWDRNQAVWAGFYHGTEKEGSFDEWIDLRGIGQARTTGESDAQ